MLELILPVNSDSGFKTIGYATSCSLCLKKITECQLLRCSGCKLVFYCSKEHQKSHWSKHKDLCRAVQVIMRKCSKYLGLFDNTIYKDHASWTDCRRTITSACHSILKRNLLHEELALFMNPFVCNVCHTYQNIMITCKDCSVISYCSKEHQRKDQTKHSAVCTKIKFALDWDIICQKTFLLKASISDAKELPYDMHTFIDNYVNIETDPFVEKMFTSYFLSNSLTIPLTIIYALVKANSISKDKQSLVIHVVGSGSFESGAFWCWEYIFHYFTNLKYLHILFVGPEISEYFLTPVEMCNNCKDSRGMKITLKSQFYHEYIKTTPVESPDVVTAFNCGFSAYLDRSGKNTWKDSIRIFCSYPGAVVVFTGYNFIEAMLDIKTVKKYSKNKNLNILVEAQENPFKSLIPLTNSLTDNNSSVCFINQFINIITT